MRRRGKRRKGKRGGRRKTKEKRRQKEEEKRLEEKKFQVGFEHTPYCITMPLHKASGRSYILYIANLDFQDLTVVALAQPVIVVYVCVCHSAYIIACIIIGRRKIIILDTGLDTF